MGTHSALGERSHTTAHTPKQGPSLPRPQHGLVLPAKSLLFCHAFIYIHFPVHREPPLYQQGEKIRQSCRHSSISDHLSSCFSTSPTNGPRLLSQPKTGTHSAFGEKSHTRAYTPNHGYFRWGWYHYPRSVSHGSETLRGQGVERQTLPLLGLGWGHSRRTQRAFGTAMRLCVSLFRRRRGPAGLRDPFSSVEIVACMPCAQGLSACARHGRYHYPRRALRAVETPDGRLQKRLICRFLRLGSLH